MNEVPQHVREKAAAMGHAKPPEGYLRDPLQTKDGSWSYVTSGGSSMGRPPIRITGWARATPRPNGENPTRAATGPATDNFVPIVENLGDIRLERVDWLWRHFLAAGKFHMLFGRKGVGKTTLCMTLAAHLSAGRAPFSEAGAVLLISQEDGWADQLAPMLKAAKANPDNVHIARTKLNAATQETEDIFLEVDLPAITDQAEKIDNLRLVVIDPIVSVTAGLRDAYSLAAVRKALRPVTRLADRTGAAVVGVGHFRKSKAGMGLTSGGIMDEVNGSGAWTHVPRIVLVAFRSAGANLLTHDCKLGAIGNLIAKRDRQVAPYHIEPDEADPDVPRLVFGQALHQDVEDLSDDSKASTALEAQEWLKDNLDPGEPTPTNNLKEMAQAAGLSWRTLERQKDDLHIRSVKIGHTWHWRRPL